MSKKRIADENTEKRQMEKWENRKVENREIERRKDGAVKNVNRESGNGYKNFQKS